MRRGPNDKVPALSRKVMERNRRIFTKDLLSRLASVINPSPAAAPKRTSSIQLLEEAPAYVKQLQQRVEMLKERRKQLVEDSTAKTVFTITDLDSEVEVRMSTCRLNDKFLLTRVINVLEQECAPVVAVNYSREGDRINYIISSQAIYSRIGIDTSRLHERLNELS